MRRHTPIAIPLMTLMVLLACGTARAATAIQDNAGFFSSDAVAKADQQIADIKKEYHKDMRVETYAQIPPDLADQYNANDKDRFYSQWARRQARQASVE